jgi:hypothetical protein
MAEAGGRGPEYPSEPPEPGTRVLIRYHTRGGVDSASVGEVREVDGPAGSYTATVSVNFAVSLQVDVTSLAVMTTWPPDEDPQWKRAGVLKVLREHSGGDTPAVDQQVKRFNTYGGLKCGNCGSGGAVVERGEPTCGGCGERIDMDAAEQRRK